MANEIVKQEEKPYIPIVGGVAQPRDIDGVFRLAQLFGQAGMLPHGVNTPQQVCIMLMAGMEVGLSPTQAIQNVMVVNNRPTIWGDAAIGLVQASKKMTSHEEGIKGEGDQRYGYCTVKREDDPTPHTVTFSVQDAKNAGLWGKAGPWKAYPDRMLTLRARAFALRNKFADVLKGLGIREEVEDIEPPTRTVSVSFDDKPRRSLNDKLDAQGAGDAQSTPAAPAPAPERKGFTLTGDPIEDALANAQDIKENA